jgi:hypothetical protein
LASTAVLFRFTSSCRRLGVELWAYLQDVLTRLPAMPKGQPGEPLPDRWQAARQAKGRTPRAPPPETTGPPLSQRPDLCLLPLASGFLYRWLPSAQAATRRWEDGPRQERASSPRPELMQPIDC